MKRFRSKDPETVITVPSRGVLETTIYSSGKKKGEGGDAGSEEFILNDCKTQNVQSNEVYCQTEITRNYSDAAMENGRPIS